MNLDALIEVFHSQVSLLIVESALEPCEVTVGKAFRVDCEQGTAGRIGDTESSRDFMVNASARILLDSVETYFHEKKPMIVVKPCVDPRLTGTRWNRIG
jgi:hypothetical protein